MLLNVLCLLTVFTSLQGPASGSGMENQWEGVALPSDSLLQAVREEYAAGRYWRGVQLLRAALPGDAGADRETLLLLAEGEAGWGNWKGVRDLLEEPLASGTLPAAEPWYLLGRSLEELGAWEGAAEAYEAFLAGAAGEEGSEDRLKRVRAARGRLARALARLGRFQEAEEVFLWIRREDPKLGGWVALEVARLAAAQGATKATRVFLSAVPQEEVREEGRELPARSLLAAGDSAGAEAAFWSALPGLPSASRRAGAWNEIGRLRLAKGDSSGARGAFHQVLDQGVSGPVGVEAASALLMLGLDSVRVARRSAELLAGAGRAGDALRAWRIYETLEPVEAPPEVSLAVARLHLRLGDPGRALERLAPLLDSRMPEVGTVALALQVEALRAQGRGADARKVQDTLVARFPTHPGAVEILFLRADALQDRGDIPGALEGFQAAVSLAPAQNLAGQARMRMGQIHLTRGRLEEASRVYQEYMSEFPEGRRWDEAAFWAGRSLLELGKAEEAKDILDDLKARFPLSYYTFHAGALLGERYAPDISAPATLLTAPDYLVEGLSRVDLLLEGGFQEGASREVANLTQLVRGQELPEDRKDHLVCLAWELNQRGLTREGINLGWEAFRLEGEWDRNLLAAIYPFPYREMVFRSAHESGLDPFLMAGLMRQESAFWVRAVSTADARGLMQLLPTTGAELARVRGPRPFNADTHLFRPEVNVYLGMAFFSDLRRRFGEDLSILLSAYNAGPTRARRWREFPEAGDLPRFVERIPFAETRGYVKNVLRNREIYAWLYGGGAHG
ncbi:MAG: transglycosylase SLT domain-containing protein [Longimicrobiales bacterium]